MMKNKYTYFSVMLLLIVLLNIFLFRYTIISASTNDSRGAYKLDRLTGKLYLIVGTNEIEVKKK